MKNIYNYLLIIIILIGVKVNAQIGINTENPKSTLDIRANSNNLSTDGFLIPALSKKELAAKENTVYTNQNIGIKVYINDISGPISGPSLQQVINVIEKGFYYFSERLIWEKFVSDFTDDAWVNNPNANRLDLATDSFGNDKNENSNVSITDNGFLGININNPEKRIDINAATFDNNTDYIKFTNLKEVQETEITSTLVIDVDGNIYKNDVENLNGQIMRVPIKGFTVGTVDNPTQGSLRLDFGNTSISPACIQNNINICNTNFINTIKGVSEDQLKEEVTLTAGTGTNARITERIILPKGTFKIQVRLVGHYTTAFTPSPIESETNVAYTPGTAILKLAIGNNELSLANYSESTYGSDALTSILYTEFIVLEDDDPEKRTLDLLFNPTPRNRPFTIIPDKIIDGKKVGKSFLLIERIR
ncbi:hypothetical protein [Faecalibacter bovis]|uniref:Uncharacterized protein n=1 Tax=Faecalibacter bovis TaxID=2898187 RepID=A0ABX7XCT8_9FLAO|nr:hypothetical protein [Faecalibacter bovis]QTV05648.1 hypothetical protein J9309_12895 [Faecalibacter bovis]